MNALYICYQSVNEPLTQTQVLPYLEGLALAGHRLVLLTYEPVPITSEEAGRIERALAQRGVTWTWLRYHKRPSLPATLYDIAAGVRTGLRLVREHRLQLVHARSHVGAAIAAQIRRRARVRMIFDFRGFLAEEYAAAGVWQETGPLFRLTKWMERRLIRAADGYVVLTQRAAAQLRGVYAAEMAGKPLEVIPCCVDLRRFESARAGGDARPTTIVYAGKLGGIYAAREMAAFVEAARVELPDLNWQIWTQTDETAARRALGSAADAPYTRIGRLAPEQLAQALPDATAALAFYQPSPANIACSPTKIAEYLAAGLPVVCPAAVGDVEDVLNDARGPVGVLIDGYTPESYEAAAKELAALLKDRGLPDRCRAVARERFDLETVGWRAYCSLYGSMAEGVPA